MSERLNILQDLQIQSQFFGHKLNTESAHKELIGPHVLFYEFLYREYLKSVVTWRSDKPRLVKRKE
jgi:hypothetical protein